MPVGLPKLECLRDLVGWLRCTPCHFNAAEDSQAWSQNLPMPPVLLVYVSLGLIVHAGAAEAVKMEEEAKAKAAAEEVARMRQERANHFAGAHSPMPSCLRSAGTACTNP